MYKPKTLPIIGAALLLIASFALFAIGSPDFAIACSMASVGIVINGVETDSEVSLEKLQQMRNDAVKAMGELRDKFHSRSAGEGQPGSWEGEERKQWEDVNAHIKAIDARMKQLRSSADIDAAWNEAQENEQRDQRDRQGGGRSNVRCV